MIPLAIRKRRHDHRRALALGTLRRNVSAAIVTLDRVAEEVETRSTDAANKIHVAVETMLRLADDLEPLENVDGAGATNAWSLDSRWHPTVFEVASSRPKVLLTVAANALRAVIDVYHHVLGEVWPADFELELQSHLEAIEDLWTQTVDLRRRLNEAGTAAH